MKVFKTLFLTAVIAFGTTQANSQILYKAVAPETGKTSWILGTHHFAPLSAVDSMAEIPGIIKAVDALYGEVDMQAMSDPVQMMAMQKAMMAPADSTLDKVLTPAQLDSVKTVWDRYTDGQLPLEMMYMVKPAAISTQLVALMTQKILPQLNPMEGIDMTMQARAREEGKEVSGFETMAFQADLLFNRPISKQAKALMETVSDIDKEEERAVKLSDAYMKHDIASIFAMIAEMEAQDADNMEVMIYRRNAGWLETMKREMPGKSLFVVVGAGHLPGEKGVLEGLRKAGYTVTGVE